MNDNQERIELDAPTTFGHKLSTYLNDIQFGMGPQAEPLTPEQLKFAETLSDGLLHTSIVIDPQTYVGALNEVIAAEASSEGEITPQTAAEQRQLASELARCAIGDLFADDVEKIIASQEIPTQQPTS